MLISIQSLIREVKVHRYNLSPWERKAHTASVIAMAIFLFVLVPVVALMATGILPALPWSPIGKVQ